MSILLVILLAPQVKATLQARPDATSLTNKTANYFFEQIRKMEAIGGTLGKEAVIDPTTFMDSTQNGVDVHMAKNTEWGTAAMLAASSYGETEGSSTTGNSSGIYQMGDTTWEYVAGIWNASNSNVSQIKEADRRYYNLYISNTSIPGDATFETASWKGASYYDFVTSTFPIFLRGHSGLFGYCSGNGVTNSSGGSRAVLVIGTAL